MSHVFKRFHRSHEGKTLCRRLLPPDGHTWNSMYASFALGLRVLTDRLLVFPWTGGCCSTMPEGGIRWNVYFRPICNSLRVQNVLYLSRPVCTYTSQIFILLPVHKLFLNHIFLFIFSSEHFLTFYRLLLLLIVKIRNCWLRPYFAAEISSRSSFYI